MKTVATGPERAESFTTISGRPIERLYTAEHLSGWTYDRELADPGQFPYTRGIHPTGYRGKLWTMRQFAGFGTPEETNLRYKQLLAAGARASASPSICRRSWGAIRITGCHGARSASAAST